MTSAMMKRLSHVGLIVVLLWGTGLRVTHAQTTLSFGRLVPKRALPDFPFPPFRTNSIPKFEYILVNFNSVSDSDAIPFPSKRLEPFRGHRFRIVGAREDSEGFSRKYWRGVAHCTDTTGTFGVSIEELGFFHSGISPAYILDSARRRWVGREIWTSPFTARQQVVPMIFQEMLVPHSAPPLQQWKVEGIEIENQFAMPNYNFHLVSESGERDSVKAFLQTLDTAEVPPGKGMWDILPMVPFSTAITEENPVEDWTAIPDSPDLPFVQHWNPDSAEFFRSVKTNGWKIDSTVWFHSMRWDTAKKGAFPLPDSAAVFHLHGPAQGNIPGDSAAATLYHGKTQDISFDLREVEYEQVRKRFRILHGEPSSTMSFSSSFMSTKAEAWIWYDQNLETHAIAFTTGTASFSFGKMEPFFRKSGMIDFH